ncbi:hypothetical protein I4U23_017211 [Adineta vaga]|nr:hypothetical protein I4U23_017211 [Adineta vaga]
MDASNTSNNTLYDLPDEILLEIFNKLNMIDVLCSLVDVNKRFNRLILDPFYISNLDMSIKSSLLERTSRLDIEKIGKLFKKILPRISDHIQKLAIPSCSIEYIINIDYPQLYSLTLVNVEPQKLLEHLTEETTVFHLLNNQIRHLRVDILSDQNESNIFLLILNVGKHLTDMMFHHRFSSECLGNTSFDLSRSHISSTLTKLTINVTSFDDCFYLLDGRLEYLTILIIDIKKISYSALTINNTVKLFKLKQFSLTSHRLTHYYDYQVVPLLRRMINIENLTLFLHVIRTDSAYIDGTDLYKDVLDFMPQLDRFIFSINTEVFTFDTELVFPSNDDIQQSFIKKGNRRISSHVYNRIEQMNGKCHIYSLPYQFETYLLMINSFDDGVFDKVRSITMIDSYPFEHDLFKNTFQHFPFVRNITLINSKAQKNKKHPSTLITFPHLEKLDITNAHIDYAEHFLSEKKIRLPCLLELHIAYETLIIVTNNFTNDLGRYNCSHVRHLITNELYVRSKDFYLYFPLL